jgi:uncharacterized protein
VNEYDKVELENNKSRFFCALSIDGNQEMHNANRSFSFDMIDRAFFKQTWTDQPVKMTISQKTLPMLTDGIIFLHSEGFRFTANLACASNWSGAEDLVGILEDQLNRLAQWYLDHPDVDPCNLLSLPLDRIEPSLAVNGQWTQARYCGIGHSIAAYSIDGTKYPCQVMVPVGEDSINSQAEALAPCDSMLIDERCRDCLVSQICPTCYASNKKLRGDFAIRDTSECKHFRVQCKASAFMYGNMLASNLNYKAVSKLNSAQIQRFAKSALMIIDQLPDTAQF